MAKVLIVDDDPAARDLIVTLLGYSGHTAHEASDGAEALVAAQIEPPDLVIADLMMPTMDGFEFVRRLRDYSSFASTPVVFYTASYLESEVRSLANACGVHHIITKPADPEQILQVINAVLGTAHAPVATPPVEEFQREHLSLLTTKLSQRPSQGLLRLEAMIQLGLQLASERDPQRLLSTLCNAARKIIGAKYAMVDVLDGKERKVHHAFASGMNSELVAQLCALEPLVATDEAAHLEHQTRRLSMLPGDPRIVGLPHEFPPIHSLLSAPIVSPDRLYGWLYLTDKLGAAEFSEEDEGIARILAAQVGRIYENGSLYEEISRYVQRLEAEIAERKRAQDEINQLNAELEQRVATRTAELKAVNQELEAFSYSVSHDLRAPLRAIGGFSEMLLESYEALLPPEGQGMLRKVQASTRRMRQLIDDLLNFARLARQPLSEESIDTSQLVELVLQELPLEDQRRQVDVRIGGLPRCRGDYSLLRQVWVNLLSNAFKFTRGRDGAMIEIGCMQGVGEKTYFVRDNGVGFDMQYAKRLFGVFERLHRADEFEGTGIGLSIVRKIVTRHGGYIWAESKPGHGATFYFKLPDVSDSKVGQPT